MKSINLHELKTQKEEKVSELIKYCKMFFAFSNQQFDENKTELKEDEKYIHIGAGAYMPKSNLDLYLKGIETINKWYADEVKKTKNGENEILYELNNYECFYTGDISDAYEVLKNRYTIEQINVVYNKNRHLQNC